MRGMTSAVRANFPSHVSAEAVIPLDAVRARRRLWQAMTLAGERVDADTVEFPLVVGVRRGRGLHKRVRAQLRAPWSRGRNHVAALRWQPTGAVASCYPRLDGKLTLTAIDPITCLLTFTGDYRPPFGALGRVVDTAGLSRVAAASARAVTYHFARALKNCATTEAEEVPR